MGLPSPSFLPTPKNIMYKYTLLVLGVLLNRIDTLNITNLKLKSSHTVGINSRNQSHGNIS